MKMSFKIFCSMFGVEHRLNGVEGFLNKTNDFFPKVMLQEQFNQFKGDIPITSARTKNTNTDCSRIHSALYSMGALGE